VQVGEGLDRDAANFLEIHSGAKRIAVAGDHDGADVQIAIGVVDRFEQFAAQVAAERVMSVKPVQREAKDPAVLRNFENVAHWRRLSGIPKFWVASKLYFGGDVDFRTGSAAPNVLTVTPVFNANGLVPQAKVLKYYRKQALTQVSSLIKIEQFHFAQSNNKEVLLTKLLTLVLLGIGVSAVAMATVPEIDPGSGINAIALLGGGLLLIRSRRKK
jgi:hypothetical protein